MSGKRFVVQSLYILAAVGAGFAGGTLSDHARNLAWGNASQNTIVSANEFRLVDKAGKLKARLFSETGSEGKLTLYGRNEQEKASIAATPLGGELVLLSRPENQAPELNWRVDLSATVTDGAKLYFNHPSTFPELILEATKLGTSLYLSGRDHKSEIDIADDIWSGWSGGGPYFRFWKDKTPRISLELDNKGNPGISLSREDGNTLWGVP
jgi:hypothetical protein